MLDKPKRKQLKIEPRVEDDNLLEQLVASVKRIEDGLNGMHEAVTEMSDRLLVLERAGRLEPTE